MRWAQTQYIWDLKYIDTPIVRLYDQNTDGDYDDASDNTLYFMTDANMNVTALMDASGNVIERYAYDAYGEVTIYEANWAADADNISDVDNNILYAGYHYDAETGLYHVRNRVYHTSLGIFITRDPLGFVDGVNVYQYTMSNPIVMLDSSGLATPASQPAVSWPETLTTPPKLKKSLVSKKGNNTPIHHTTGKRSCFSWRLGFQGKARFLDPRKKQTQAPVPVLNFMAAWQLYLYDFKFSDECFRKSKEDKKEKSYENFVEIKQFVRTKDLDQRNRKWTRWSAARNDNLVKFGFTGTKEEIKAKEDEYISSRKEFTGLVPFSAFGAGVNVYQDPRKANGWQPNRMVHNPENKKEFSDRPYSWWDGPSYSHPISTKSGRKTFGSITGRQWWFYIEVYSVCDGKRKIVDSATFKISMYSKFKRGETNPTGYLQVSNIKWLGVPKK